MELYKIETENLRLDGGAMFGVVPKVMWEKKYPSDKNNLCNWSVRCLLVVDGDRKILIDNGMGDKQDEKFFKHYYLNGEGNLYTSLDKAGFRTEDITDVVLTHLHFDHCGGSVRYNEAGELVTTFPKAKYWVSEAQWKWAVDPNRREKASFLKENILPIKEQGQLHLIEEEGELYPNFEVQLYDGHTAGQVIPLITYKGKKIAFMADLIPSVANIPMPWIPAYDTRPLISLEDKKKFFKRAIKDNYTLFFQHDLYHECCTLEDSPKGAIVKEVFDLKDFIER